MTERVTATITMELCSDTIFGSGFSVPGGEDIAVCQDEKGYPYLKGSTLKGLLRESLENYLAWTGQSQQLVGTLCGESDWDGTADDRRIQLTALHLDPRPVVPEDCFSTRIFTSLEHGVVKTDTLRTAVCIHRGMRFSGLFTCHQRDLALFQTVVQGIKWVGTMRSRGFGRVACRLEPSEQGEMKCVLGPCRCIRYRLQTELPVIVTDLSHSRDNSYTTRGYIPGAAVRGMVVNALANQYPDWFAAHRAELLSEKTRFLDAIPWQEDSVGLPGIMGFYGQKGSTEVTSVLNADVAGMKRAKPGAFCALEGEQIRGWTASTGGNLRIQRHVGKTETSYPFQTQHIDAGQTFEGYIWMDDPSLAEPIGRAFQKTVWLGADRYEGFGKCAVLLLESVEAPSWQDYGYSAGDTTDSTLYLLAISPLTMLNDWGEPCGLDVNALAARLGVEQVNIEACSTAMVECGGYNRTWKCRVPAIQMYDRGSIFKLRCTSAPEAERLLNLQRTGLGIRRAEGLGQVLFLRRELLEQVKELPSNEERDAYINSPGIRLRRARYQWIMEFSKDLYQDGISRSQMGTIQALCEKAMASGDTQKLLEQLDKNLTERGPWHAGRFHHVNQVIRSVLETTLENTLGVKGPDSERDRLKLLCELFDYSRKEGRP